MPTALGQHVWRSVRIKGSTASEADHEVWVASIQKVPPLQGSKKWWGDRYPGRRVGPCPGLCYLAPFGAEDKTTLSGLEEEWGRFADPGLGLRLALGYYLSPHSGLKTERTPSPPG